MHHKPHYMKAKIISDMINKNSIIRVILATSALGMGVNMHYISQVIHIGPPSTLDAYVQEIGRAGRSGDPSSAILYYCNRDISELKNIKGIGYARNETILSSQWLPQETVITIF